MAWLPSDSQVEVAYLTSGPSLAGNSRCGIFNDRISADDRLHRAGFPKSSHFDPLTSITLPIIFPFRGREVIPQSKFLPKSGGVDGISCAGG